MRMRCLQIYVKKIERVQLVHTQLISCPDLNYLSKFTKKRKVSKWIIKKPEQQDYTTIIPQSPRPKGSFSSTASWKEP